MSLKGRVLVATVDAFLKLT